MAKSVIFFMTYEGAKNKGHRTFYKSYSIFTRKTTILEDIMKWSCEELELIKKQIGEEVYSSNIKIIGL